jgi:putative nicotinate phosphoribosyltransferase
MKGSSFNTVETYTLQFRSAEHGYFIVYGIADQLEKIFGTPISQEELDFAIDFYQNTNNTYFNREMWQDVIAKHKGFLPLDVMALPDGTAILPGDPILSVTGLGELAAHFEPELHRIFYQTAVATKSHLISQVIGSNRFIEVGKRGTPNELMHLQAMSAMYAGGGLYLTSNDAAVACYPFLKDVGTIGHRFLQFFDSEEEAFRRAINTTDFTVLLVDLKNSLQGIDKAIELKKEFRSTGKKIWIRLDSGDIKEQALYCLQKMAEHNFTDKSLDILVIEDLNSIQEIQEIDSYLLAKQKLPVHNHVMYGAGHLLIIDNCTRHSTSSAYKLSQIHFSQNNIKPTMKFTDSLGKKSLPGQPILAEIDGERLIMQQSELTEKATSLFKTVVSNGKLKIKPNPKKAFEISQTTFIAISFQSKQTNQRTELSEETVKLVEQIASFQQ